MVLNPGKCRYLIINIDIANESIESGKKTSHAEAEQKLLDIIIDKDLNFQSHATSIIKTAKQKCPYRLWLFQQKERDYI